MSAEDQALLNKISEISGRINRHKNGGSPKPQPWNKYVASASQNGNSSYRSAPYPPPSSRSSRPSSSRHRTLVINNSGNTSSAEEHQDGSHSTGWVTKHDRHVQLINTNILEQETQARSKAIEQTRMQKALSRDQKEQQRIQSYLQSGKATSAQVSTSGPHEVSIDGLRFRVLKGGSKLARLRGESTRASSGVRGGLIYTDTADATIATPKQAKVGGVLFLRSKNGNLYRSGIIKAKRYTQYHLFDDVTHGTRSLGIPKKINERCKRFTLTGILCPIKQERAPSAADILIAKRRTMLALTLCLLGRCAKGPRCPYIHNPSEVAICRKFLQTGSCPEGDSCDLSHDPTLERVPTCLHFLRGKCSNPSCHYSHIRVEPSALVCRDFATLGYCGKGKQCLDRHIFECPDYANTGICRSATKCRLPHVDHAGQLKKKHVSDRRNNNQNDYLTDKMDDDDIVSDEDEEMDDDDDVDSEGMEEFFGSCSPHDETLTQQQDYVGF